MSEHLLPLSVWLHVAFGRVRERAVTAWREREDESGIDEAVSKMIWLAVGIGVAVAATAFFVGIFNTAKSNVPDPVAPTP
jgi:hypothetical protein